MRELESESMDYILYHDGKKLLLEVVCGHSFLFTTRHELTPDEIASYKINGKGFLRTLAEHVRYIRHKRGWRKELSRWLSIQLKIFSWPSNAIAALRQRFSIVRHFRLTLMKKNLNKSKRTTAVLQYDGWWISAERLYCHWT
jgi:hypothetical protein